MEIMETGVFSEAVHMDGKKSEKLGITVAPTYIMNGIKLVGSQPYETLEQLVIANLVPKKSGT